MSIGTSARVIRYQTKKGSFRSVTIPAPRSEVLDDRIVLHFEGLPAGLNKTSGRHWASNYADKEFWKQYARVTAEECGARVVDSMAHLHWHIQVGDARVRDEDNLRGGMKPVQDGLVLGGLIRGDSIWDIQTHYTFSKDKPQGFSITITSL